MEKEKKLKDLPKGNKRVREWSKKVHGLTLEWNYHFQKLSAIFGEIPAILTKKLFSEEWVKSAKTIAPICILGSFLPSQPWFYDRRYGTIGICPIEYSYYNFTSTFPFQKQFQNLRNQFNDKKIILSQEEKEKIVGGNLWDLVFNLGTCHFSSLERSLGVDIPHLNSFIPVVFNGKRYFLAIDTENRYNKILTIKQTVEMIQNEKFNFDLYEYL